MVRLARTDHREHQRREDRTKVGDHPKDRPDSERHRQRYVTPELGAMPFGRGSV
jgi:hypothetical protein